MEAKKRIAIVPGSFDPITNGHLDIVRRAAELYDKVYLAVMINSEKRKMATLQQRKKIAETAVLGIDKVEVISSEGYLWKLAEELDACAIVKGVRNSVDREYELKMAEYNSAHNPKAETVLLDTADGLGGVSSTLVREKIMRGEDISSYLPDSAICEIYKIIPQRI